MEEDKKPVERTEKQSEKKEIQVSLSEQMINALFAISALVLLAFTKILFAFGVMDGTFNGIMTLLVLGLAVAGVLWNYIKYGKPTFEFYFSAGVAFTAFLTTSMTIVF